MLMEHVIADRKRSNRPNGGKGIFESGDCHIASLLAMSTPKVCFLQ
jgi:hypothetical protein